MEVAEEDLLLITFITPYPYGRFKNRHGPTEFAAMMSLPRLRDSKDLSLTHLLLSGQTKMRVRQEAENHQTLCHLHCREQMWKGQL
ncbi:uncharacterized protein LOC143032902 isoform X2 [Oratosquilla oratoria]|uniref:uncharacterized protein LOC143032902 isoform X2 n=1 Tax=Oratosquilla oratoria TaxID=337810 RepID=UPI003F76C4A5